MMYDVLEARIEFENNQLQRITLLVKMSVNDVRAIFATTTPRNGYMHIPPGAKINDELLQEVAAYGLETVDRDSIFRGWRTKYSHQK